MRPTRIYVSAPITGHDPDQVRERFRKAGLYVRSLGAIPILPNELRACDRCSVGVDTPNHRHTWQEWMKVDLAEMLTCHVIMLLPGWQESPGARLEHYVATSCGLAVMEMPVKVLNDREDNFTETLDGAAGFERQRGLDNYNPREDIPSLRDVQP